MSYVVFARKWRPQDFESVIGQNHITATLQKAIEKNKVSHSYLFTGPRGVGKTSTARILAKALNCESSKKPTSKPCNKCENCISIAEGNHIDVIEIDGASNRGIDEVRQLRESVKFAPVKSRFKVYTIDEVHMLTTEAFNALLKTLEEPPPYVNFIFATTDPDRILPTILSRCQRFDFRRIPLTEIIEMLKQIAKEEKIKADEEAFFYIAKASEGSLRDAESILDQMSSLTDKIDIKSVNSVLGLIEEDFVFNFVDSLIKHDLEKSLKLLDQLFSHGKDPGLFLNSLIEHFRNLTFAHVAGQHFSKIVDLPKDLQDKALQQAKDTDYRRLAACFKELLSIQASIKRSDSKRIILEMGMVRIAELFEGKLSQEMNYTHNSAGASAKPGKKDIKPAYSNQHSPLVNKPAHHAVEEKIIPAKEEKAKPGENKAVSLLDVKGVWNDAIVKIKSQRMSVGTYLDEGALIGVSDNVVNVGFLKEHNFHKEFLEQQKNLKVLEETFSRLLKSSVKFLLKTTNVLPKQEAAVIPNSADQINQAPPEAESGSGNLENFIQSAIDTFKGRFV